MVELQGRGRGVSRVSVYMRVCMCVYDCIALDFKS